MADSIKLTNFDQLDAMSEAHHAHGNVAHATASHIDGNHGTLRSCDNWSGPGFDDISQAMNNITNHLRAFGDIKHAQAEAVAQAKTNFAQAETKVTQGAQGMQKHS